VSSPVLTAPRPGWVERLGGRLSRREWTAVAGMGAAVVLLHVLGWGSLLLVVAPQHLRLGDSGVFGVGLGVTAYTLGMRHAFDADHIAAIDSTTRKLMAEGGRPVSVGFWFSLGHSSVVFALCALLAVGVRALAAQIQDGSSALQQVAGVVGTSVSGAFLTLIGTVNLVVLVGIVRVFRRMRSGDYDERELEEQLERRGVLNRLLRGVTRAVTRPGQMYPVGLLFGLGFDTVTEVSLLVLAGGAAAVSLPWYAVLTLPVLFAAGMSALDSIDGCFMNFAYGWAFSRPVRKVFYNLVITGLSVVVALVIGAVELLSVLTGRLGITSGPLAAVGRLDLNLVGYVVVAVFVLAWAGALAVWRLGRIEERWSAGLRGPQAEAGGLEG
jgi:nickel/cobalt transporter (NiCoT) family protein